MKIIKRSSQLILSIFGVTLLLIGFQNCENNAVIKTNLDSSMKLDVSDAQATDPDAPASDLVDMPQVQDDTSSNPIIVDENGDVVTDPDGAPIAEDNSSPAVDNDADTDEDFVIDETMDDEDLRAKCNKMLRKINRLVLVSAGSSLLDIKGNTRIKTEGLDMISRVKGNTRILGLAANSKVNQISFIDGNTILCGVSVDQVSNYKGNLLVIGADVGSVSNFKGNIKIYDGKVTGSISNHKGNLRVK